jgi:hypothetical protein
MKIRINIIFLITQGTLGTLGTLVTLVTDFENNE